MLKEKVSYKEGLPINVVTANIEEYPIHFHDDIEVAFVLEGAILLKNGYYTFTLRPGDIFILNDREIHSFTRMDKDNVVMMMQLDNTYFSKYYENFKNSFFVTDAEDEDESMEGLRKILSRIMMQIIEKGHNHEQNIIESTHNFISLLLSDFQYFVMEEGRFINEAKNKGNKILAGRMSRITDYLYENYGRRLTLSEVAEKEHLSIFYLSHVIKTATGLSFQELLSFIRVEESEKLVLGSNKKIGDISEETGFSAVRYYIKYFTKWFGMHPAEYRRLYTGKVSSRETLAKYQMIPSSYIKELIKKEQNEVYSDFEKRDITKSEIIEFDVGNLEEDAAFNECQIKTCLKGDHMKPAALLLKIFKDLNEELILSGNLFAVSMKSSRGSKKIMGLSILIYNINDEISEMSSTKLQLIEAVGKLKPLNHKMEALFRISGLNGSYKISRLKFSKENILSGYNLKLTRNDKDDERSMIINKWSANPSATVTVTTVIDTLAIQTNLDGLSGELILIDAL